MHPYCHEIVEDWIEPIEGIWSNPFSITKKRESNFHLFLLTHNPYSHDNIRSEKGWISQGDCNWIAYHYVNDGFYGLQLVTRKVFVYLNVKKYEIFVGIFYIYEAVLTWLLKSETRNKTQFLSFIIGVLKFNHHVFKYFKISSTNMNSFFWKKLKGIR